MSYVTDKERVQTVRTLLELRAAEQGDAVYAVFPQTHVEITFADLLRGAQALAAELAASGAQSGERIAFLLPNSVQALRLFVGIQAAGAVALPLSLLALPPQLAFVLEHAGVQRVFVGSGQRALVEEAALLLRRPLRIVEVEENAPAPWESAASTAEGWPWPDTGAEGDSVLMYTSGTTGRPKGVRLSARNLLSGARFVSEAHALSAADRVLAVLPLYHINAQVVTVLATLWHGGSLVMPPRFSASAFWGLAAEYRCTWLNVVPTMVAYLLAAPVLTLAEQARHRVATVVEPQSDRAGAGALSLPAIRFCRSASAPLAAELQLEFEHRFGIGIIETMGLTETAAPCFSNPLEPSLRRIGSPGKPFGNKARIADIETGQSLPAGHTGEIQILGDNVTVGYLNAEEENAKAFTADGWLRTGDLGYRDTDGYYFVTGRIKELIIKGGENISPREIDEALLAHGSVLEAASVGVPDLQYGQQIEAAVVLKEHAPALSEAELLRWCAERIGQFKTPRSIRFMEELPKGPSGKVQRLKLLEVR